MGYLTELIETHERDLREEVRDLQRAASSLAEQMKRLADRLMECPEAPINSLGEVQTQGSDVDRRCAVVDRMRRKLDRLHRIERARHAQQIARDHARLCHSDGSECEDGCQASADPEELARYQNEI